MKHHDLKITRPYFDDVVSGKKTFEVRLNDRQFSLGDEITLREWAGDTGRFVLVTVIYLLPLDLVIGGKDLHDWVVLGIKLGQEPRAESREP